MSQLYSIKQNGWSLGGQYFVFDKNKSPIYQILGKVFSWGDKLSFQTMQSEEVAFIEQELWSFKGKYRLHKDGALFAELRETSGWFSQSYCLDVPGPNDYEIEGSFWGYEYLFKRSGATVASVSKEFTFFNDHFGIKIDDGEDVVSILASTIIIDLINQKKSD